MILQDVNRSSLSLFSDFAVNHFTYILGINSSASTRVECATPLTITSIFKPFKMPIIISSEDPKLYVPQLMTDHS